jgi:hypothetical protein
MAGGTSMELETAEALEGLRRDMRRLEPALSLRIEQSEQALSAKLRETRDGLRAEFRDGLGENRRHADVLFESLRDDIRIVAEEVAALSAKVDGLNR